MIPSNAYKFMKCAGFLITLCAGWLSSVSAQELPQSVLFIGNSFTLGSGNGAVVGAGGVGGLFKQMVEARNMSPIEVKRAAELKVDWSFHLAEDSVAREMIASQVWDAVVMQEVSTAPGEYGDKPVENFFTDGRSLAELIRKSSPESRLVIFQPWAREAKHSIYRGSSKFSGGPAGMQEVIDGNINKLAAEIKAEVAPVGDAFLKCGELYPDLTIYLEDSHHANTEGCYLAAAVFFAKLLKADPRGLPPLLNVSEENAKKLQEVAWDVVSSSQGVASISSGSAKK